MMLESLHRTTICATVAFQEVDVHAVRECPRLESACLSCVKKGTVSRFGPLDAMEGPVEMGEKINKGRS